MTSSMYQERYEELLKACKCGGVGLGTIILLHNAAGVLEELGKKYSLLSCLTYAAGLREKGKVEFDAITAAEYQKQVENF